MNDKKICIEQIGLGDTLEHLPVVKYLTKNLNVVIGIEQIGLGDVIACLPVIEYLLQTSDNVSVYTNYSISEERNNIICCSKLYKQIILLKEWNSFYEKDSIKIISVGSKSEYVKPEYHLVENAFRSIFKDNNPVDKKYMNYTRYNNEIKSYFDFITKKHVIINISFTEVRKQIPNDLLEKIIKLVIKNDLIPVFVGKSGNLLESGFNNVNLSNGINLVNRLHLSDLLYILSRARLLISHDGGAVHLAGMTDIPIFTFYTVVDPMTKLPIRNNEIGYLCDYAVPNIDCKYCYTRNKWHEDICKNLKYGELAKCIESFNHDDVLERISILIEKTKE